MSKPYDDALAYARARKVMLPDDYYGDMPLKARSWSFSVSGLAKLDQVQRVLDTLNDAIANGDTFKGWQDKVATGDVDVHLSRHHAENVFRTNVQSAYSVGRWQAQQRNLGARPYLMYDAINDSRTRPAHAAMDGHIARHDDPIWQSWYPPAGYQCRCSVIALSQAQAEARGHTGGPAPNVSPDKGWDYDRRGDWQEGIKQALARRVNKCHTGQFAAGNGAPGWCVPGKLQTALLAIQSRLQENPGQALERELRAGLRGDRYDKTLARLKETVALDGKLTEPQAVALRLWSGDTKKGRPFEVIGSTMRALGRGEDAPDFPQVMALVAGINQALKALPTAELDAAYRVIQVGKLPPDVRDAFMKAHTTTGGRVQYNSFTAFSDDFGKAEDQFGGTGDTWVLRLKSPRQLRNISRYTILDASEHLAPIMTQYQIDYVDKAKKVIGMSEVETKDSLPDSKQFATESSDEEEFNAFCKEVGRIRKEYRNGTRTRSKITDPDYQAFLDRLSDAG